MRHWVATISLSVFMAFALSGCVTSPPESPLPSGGKSIFERFGSTASNADYPRKPNHRLPDGFNGLYGYTRTAANELSVRFPRLPNPTLVMYVFPHLSAEGTPVPGYSTVFQLYDRAHYALPGE